MTNAIPWIEINYADPTSVDNALMGCVYWSAAVTHVCISVDPANVVKLPELRSRLPRALTLVPGIKTSPILIPAGLDNPDGWKHLAQAVHDAGALVVVLENESAIDAYLGGAKLDWDKLRAGLALLPQDVTVWWYPTLAGSGEQLQRRIRLCLAVQDALGQRVRFIDHATYWSPTSSESAGTQVCTGELDGLARLPVVPLLYCHNDATWPLAQLRAGVEKTAADVAIVYPGWRRWVDAARAFAGR